MKQLVFKNPGQIDPISVMTFGISAKQDNNAIGMFGTGLKYAIAVLIRNGYKIAIHSGDQIYNFDTMNHNIRDKNFDIVTMNNQPMSFTTELGKFWEVWMAIRELASNAMDEKGSWDLYEKYEHNIKDTSIIVGGPNIDLVYTEALKVFLTGKPLHSTPDLEIHNKPSDWIYYRGIRAYKLDKPTHLTYNILQTTTLTEDRTIKFIWDAYQPIVNTIANCSDEEIIKRFFSYQKDQFESDLNWGAAICKPSDQLVEYVERMIDELRPVSNSLVNLIQGSISKSIARKKQANLSDLDKVRLDKAVTFCKKIGYEVDRYPIIVLESLGNSSTLGMANGEKIYISQRTFHMGTKMLVGTLIEEYIHLNDRVYDMTREMQNLLIDQIVSLGEQVTKEIL